MDKKFNLLYVDDEISNLNVFKNTFRRDYNIFTAESAREGLEVLEQENIDLILTDQRMPEMNGVDFLKQVILKYPEPSRILITAFADFSALKEAVNEAKIFQYIQKPWEEDEIKHIIDNALEIHYLRQKNIRLNEELKISNAQLVKLNNELLELDKLKFQFLRIIGHEIRTPLNGLICSTSLFKEAFIDEDFQKHQQLFEILEHSIQRLEHFVLLAEQITSFKANKQKVNPELISINKLIDESFKTLKDKLDEKDLKLELYLCNNNSDSCFADKQLIGFCLNVIIDNAIKYSGNNDRIIVKTLAKDESVFIEIVDNGPGFPPIVLKNIYKPFITDWENTKDGTGLNLALAKLIMEAHNGAITIRNYEIKGSSVQLILKNNFQKN